LVQLLGPKLDIDKVGLLQNLIHFVHLFSLELIDMSPQFIEKVIDRVPNGMTKIELFTVRDHHAVLSHLIEFFVHILNEILGCCLQEQDLIIVVPMVGQIAAFFTD
jgi:hypothetical protein